MKTKLSSLLLGACGLLLALPAVSARAGSAIAGDGHGGYGFAYGDYSKEKLEHDAIHRCREKSSYRDDVHIVYATDHKGAGIIIRYYEGDQEHISSSAGGRDEHEVYEVAMRYIREHDGHRPEVVERWSDD